jgi:hypothetical protein
MVTAQHEDNLFYIFCALHIFCNEHQYFMTKMLYQQTAE